MLISLQDIGVSFAGTTILEHITADVQEDSRIGLIGPNGAGKSTLLNMITGELENEWGEIVRKPMLGVGYLHQNSGLTGGNTIRREMRTVFQKVLDAKEQLDDLQLDMGQLDPQSAEYKEKAAAYDKLLSYYEVNDGYTIDVKIQSVLNGMGFRGRDLDTRISTLSGGEKTRLALCKLLLAEPELLILDEPTNHLDFKTLRWLEEHLKEYKGAVIVVSHDRYFLDETAKEIWEVEFQSMRVFPGNYSKYKVLKADLMARWEKEYEAQQEEIADLEDYVARNLVRATTSTAVYTYLVYLACAFTLVVMTFGQGLSLAGYGGSGIVVGLLLAVFSTILAHSIFSWCLKFLSPAFVSASKLCEPAAAAVFAAFLFHEIPKPLQILGGLIIIAGVIYYSRLEQQAA